MIAKKVRILSTILSVVMLLGLPSCQIQNTPTTDPSATISTLEITTVPETTSIETTTEPTPEETTKETTTETTAPIETTVAPTETTAPMETTQTTKATVAPTKVPAETTAAPTAPTETALAKTVYATGNVNVRSGPGTSYGKVRTVSAGTALNVIALTANNWYRLEDNTFISPSVVSDIMPTPTPTPTPSPTPDPNATPTPAGISASAATTIAKSIVTSVRSANGLTTNFAPELCSQCYKYAQTCTLYHRGYNGSYESLAGVAQSSLYVDEDGFSWSGWTCTTHSGEIKVFDTSEECIRFIVWELIVNHVPDMATNAEQTEFGVGIYRNFCGPELYYQTEYYIYISCASPSELLWQIENGDYD